MKELSAFDLHFLVEELQFLVGSKVDKIFMPTYQEVLIQLHSAKSGKNILRIMLPKLVFVSSTKPSSPKNPFGFCVFLRKYMTGTRIESIHQLGFERIVKIKCTTKDTSYTLVIELFSKGNLIFCDEKDVIISALEQQEWKSRSIKPKVAYVSPPERSNIFTIDKNIFSEKMHQSKKPLIVLALASDLGCGGVLAEEVILLAKVQKSLSPTEIDKTQVIILWTALQKVCSTKSDPQVIMEGENVIDITPFPYQIYEGKEHIASPTCSEALDKHLTSMVVSPQSKFEKRKEKIRAIIDAQEKRLKELEAEAVSFNEMGELIYHNYSLLQEMLSSLKEARKKHSWQEIIKRLKNHKIIKEIDSAKGKITLEL